MVETARHYFALYILAVSCALQIGGAVTPHDGQCHLRRVTSGGKTYYEYDEEALKMVRHLLATRLTMDKL